MYIGRNIFWAGKIKSISMQPLHSAAFTAAIHCLTTFQVLKMLKCCVGKMVYAQQRLANSQIPILFEKLVKKHPPMFAQDQHQIHRKARIIKVKLQ